WLATARTLKNRQRLDPVNGAERIVVRQGRHLCRRVLEDFDKKAAKAKADRRTAGCVVDDAGIGLGDAALHRLNEDAGVSEASFARVADDEAVGVGDCLLAVAVEAHAAEIA